MALTLLVPGTLREVWQESANLNGGNSRTIPTNIRVTDITLSRILATLYVTATSGSPQIIATAVNVNGKVVVSVQNNALPGNTAVYVLDITKLQSTQQGTGGAVGVVNVAYGTPVGAAASGFSLPVTDVNIATYPVVVTDVVLEDRYTATGASGISLPAISSVRPGRIIVVKDSGYNASANNITVTPAGTDKINNAAAALVINVSGSAIWLQANSTTFDWEII